MRTSFALVMSVVLLLGAATAHARTVAKLNIVPEPAVCDAGTCTNGKPSVCTSNEDCDLGSLAPTSRVEIKNDLSMRADLRSEILTSETPPSAFGFVRVPICLRIRIVDKKFKVYFNALFLSFAGQVVGPGRGAVAGNVIQAALTPILSEPIGKGTAVAIEGGAAFAPPPMGCVVPFGGVVFDDPDCEAGGMLGAFGVQIGK